jgi:hypothetical protein
MQKESYAVMMCTIAPYLQNVADALVLLKNVRMTAA